MAEFRKYLKLVETYSQDNRYLLNYMKDGSFDPYGHWYEVCDWLKNNGHFPLIKKLIKKTDKETKINSVDDLNEYDPAVFELLPKDIQEECGEQVVEWLMQHNPADAPSTAYMNLRSDKPLDRQTWLIHFTDNPWSIANEGFIYGVDEMDKLGLTTYMGDSAKKYGGYNFAFIADSRSAYGAAHQRKYGRHAVMFQSSGIHVHHHSDEEDQIIFYGKDVNPKDIIVLMRDDEDWVVKSRTDTKRGDKNLYSGKFGKAVAWVQKNFISYRDKLNWR